MGEPLVIAEKEISLFVAQASAGGVISVCDFTDAKELRPVAIHDDKEELIAALKGGRPVRATIKLIRKSMDMRAIFCLCRACPKQMTPLTHSRRLSILSGKLACT